MLPAPDHTPVRRKTIWGLRWSLILLLAALVGFTPSAFAAADRVGKLDAYLALRRNANPEQITSVIAQLAPGAQLPSQFTQFARRNGKLNIINGVVLDVPNRAIAQLEAHPDIFQIDHNRGTAGANFRTSITVASRAVQTGWGLTGAGVGVAVIDSGISTWHDDLSNTSALLYPYGDQRVAAFVDFVNGRTTPYDDHGHGTHVAGIIGGNGYDSEGQEAGMAPDASLVSLKVLDANGRGTISHAIAALDWVLTNRAAYNIRVVNMSVGAAVLQSYRTDPLTLAAKRVVDAGVVVVTAGGNLGQTAAGALQYGGITAPGNAPWVLTVGASSTNGTLSRSDDAIAAFSSRGPSYLDWTAKPDLVAPGVGTVSLADPLSLFYTTKAEYLVPGSIPMGYKPYLSLSGTSMAAPAVSGTVALMLQANPSLTPNAVKAILQYTAEERLGYDALTQGAGFLNTLGAIRLTRFFATAQPGAPYPLQTMWSKKIIWGSHLLSGGVLDPNANAFAPSTTWGVAKTNDGDNIIWGTTCPGGCNNIIWGTFGDDNIIWGTEGDDNIIWGTSRLGDNIIWGTEVPDDNIIWGTDCGGADCDNIIWGTLGVDNIIWGTARAGDNIIWGTSGYDNIIWGTESGDNIIWATVAADNIIWGTTSDDPSILSTESYLNSLFRYYYSDYSQYLDSMTDSDFYQYTDMLTAWINSLFLWMQPDAVTTVLY